MRPNHKDSIVFGDQINVGGHSNVGKIVNNNQSSNADPARADERGQHSTSHDSKVFMSYSRCDSLAVTDLIKRLRGLGLDVWFDDDEIRGGELWRERIRCAIQSASGVIVAFSNESAGRSWSEQAVEVALARDVRRERLLPVIPVRLDDCEVPPMPIGPGAATLADVHAIDTGGRCLETVAFEIVSQLSNQHKSFASNDETT